MTTITPHPHPQRHRHRAGLRHARRAQGPARARAASSSACATAGSTARTAARRSMASGAPARGRLARRAVRRRRQRAARPVRPQRGAEPRGVPPARAGRLPDADDRQRRRRPQGDAHGGQLDARPASSTPAARPGSTTRYRNGFERIRRRVHDQGRRAAPRSSQEIVERAKARSVVYDMVTNGVPGRRARRRRLSHADGAPRHARRAGARPGRPRRAARR